MQDDLKAQNAKVRPYRKRDSARLEEIFRAAVAVIGPQYYTAEQVAAWGGPRVTAERLDAMYTDGRRTFIAVDENDRAVAFTDFEADGHVDMLYCDPAFARRGIATLLLSVVKWQAQMQGIERLYTEASEAAKPVFSKAGYEVLHRRELEVDGVTIHNWAMELRL
ncbi:GNAT family N-acetyltransferase [Henriciella sp. AS95]|uniref:GNAT family N-acetyltransferase n=1 Tax=Henriciella sp. AS95 TaxID=3135782 RepID=UPI0031791D77